ncbi:MAG: hypothetical protein ACP5HK_01170 [Acidilobus sp.]
MTVKVGRTITPILPLILVSFIAVVSTYPISSAASPGSCSPTYPLISDQSYVLVTYAGVNDYATYFESLPLGATAMISPMLWNFLTGNGTVTMTLSDSHVYVYVNVSGVTRILKLSPVVGFPDIMYGDYSWGPFFTMTSMYPFLRLPMPTSKVPKVWSIVNYSLAIREGSYNDFSYDIWLVRRPGATSLGPSDVELMVWMYANQSLQGVPYWVMWRPVTVPSIINGSPMNLTYQVFILPRNGGPSGWMLIVLIPELNYYDGSYHGITAGEFGVNLGDLVNATVNVVGQFNGTQWETGLYLSVIQLGAEIDAPEGNMVMNFTINYWYFVNGTQPCPTWAPPTTSTASTLSTTTSAHPSTFSTTSTTSPGASTSTPTTTSPTITTQVTSTTPSYTATSETSSTSTIVPVRPRITLIELTVSIAMVVVVVGVYLAAVRKGRGLT